MQLPERNGTMGSDPQAKSTTLTDDFEAATSIDGELFVVLANSEGQRSIWPAAKPVPEGWTRVGESGSRAACAEFVEATWLDMRPKSLRDAMDGDA